MFLYHSIVSSTIIAAHLFINCLPAKYLSRMKRKQFHNIKFHL